MTKQFDEAFWTGEDALEQALKTVDPAKVSEMPAPKGGHTTLKSYKSEMPFDKSSPHFHPCPDCRGSGTFVSYTGRRVGPCFKCKGKGGAMHAITYADSQAQKARKAEIKQERIATWKAEHSASWAWIEAKQNSFDFAASMVEALNTYGSLTTNQLATVERLRLKDIERDAAWKARKAELAANAPTVNIDKIKQSFDSALASGLKRPKMRFEGFTVSQAPATGRNADSLYVVADGDIYLGKITNGKFLAQASAPQDVVNTVLATMQDPLAAAVAYGKRTGRCSCCGAELTNALSIELGIGPICRSKFAL